MAASWNSYEYAGSNPVMRTDPVGLLAISKDDMGGGDSIGGIGFFVSWEIPIDDGDDWGDFDGFWDDWGLGLGDGGWGGGGGGWGIQPCKFGDGTCCRNQCWGRYDEEVQRCGENYSGCELIIRGWGSEFGVELLCGPDIGTCRDQALARREACVAACP